jgi:hypothetical protein
MFQAFFDESEVDAVYLVAGWVATAEEWAKFDAAWNAVLSADPSIGYFRHHDTKMLKGEFEGWSNEDAQAKLAALVKVICDHEMYGVTTGLNTTTWKQAFQSDTLSPRRLKGLLKFTHHYQSCFHSAVAMVMQRQLELNHTSDIVDLVFDQQDGLLKDSIKHYSQFKSLFPVAVQKIAGEISVGNDKDTPALQAADLLAGQLTTMLRSGPGPTYQALVQCHQVIHAKAYPPKFQTFPAVVNAISWAWSEKRKLDAQIAAEDKRSGDKQTKDE